MIVKDLLKRAEDDLSGQILELFNVIKARQSAMLA